MVCDVYPSILMDRVGSLFIFRALSHIFPCKRIIRCSSHKTFLLLKTLVNKKDRSSNFPLWNFCSASACELEGWLKIQTVFHTNKWPRSVESLCKLPCRVFWGWDIAWSPRTWVKEHAGHQSRGWVGSKKLSQRTLWEVVAKSRTLNNTNRRRILQVRYKLALLTELIKNLEALKLIQSK